MQFPDAKVFQLKAQMSDSVPDLTSFREGFGYYCIRWTEEGAPKPVNVDDALWKFLARSPKLPKTGGGIRGRKYS